MQNGVDHSPRMTSKDVEFRHANELVTLSVGGREFTTFYGTLANSRSSFFDYMFQIDKKSGRVVVHHTNIIVSQRLFFEQIDF